MKQKLKSALSLLLSLAMVMTGLTITPIAELTAQADEVVFLDEIKLQDSGSVDLEHVMHWKGETFTVGVGIIAGHKDAVTWSVDQSADEKVTLGTVDNTQTYTTNAGTGYLSKVSVTVGQDAPASFTVTASAAGKQVSKVFTVQQEQMTDIGSTNFSDFNTKNRWTKDEIDLYVITPNGSNVTFTSSNTNVVTVEKRDTSDSTKLHYYGAGSELHKWTATVCDQIDTESESVTITATSGNVQKTLDMTIKQSATKITNDITISCTAEHDHNTHTHITNTQEGTFVYLDKNQTITIHGSIEGSTTDDAWISVPYNRPYDTANLASSKEGNTFNYSFDITANTKTAKGTPSTLTIQTTSGHATSKLIYIVIYDADFSTKKCYYGASSNVEIPDGGISLNEGDSGRFKTAIGDDKEKVIWSASGNTGALTLNAETGEYTATGQGGSVDVTATVQATLSGERGIYKTFNVNVSKLVPPDKLQIKSGDNVIESANLYVSDQPVTFTRYATRTDGGNINYSNYTWYANPTGYVSIKDNKDGTVTVTPTKEGKVTLGVRTETAVKAEIELNVYAPMKSASIQYMDSKSETYVTIDNTKDVINGRIYELQAVRDKDAGKTEYFTWTISDTSKAEFVDENNTAIEGNSYYNTEKDTCRIRTKQTGAFTVTAKATGLQSRSTATCNVMMTVRESVPVDYLQIQIDDEEEVKLQDGTKGWSASDPYVIKKQSGKSYIFKMRGYDNSGKITTDEFVGEYVTTAGTATASWVKDSEHFLVNPLKAGNVTLNFTDVQTGRTYSYYVKIAIPATSLSIYDSVAPNGRVKYVLKKGDALRMYAKVAPTDSTDIITWSSSNESVVSIGETDGRIQVLSDDIDSTEPVVITARANNDVVAVANVYVVKPITSLEVSGVNDRTNKNLLLDGTDVLYVENGDTATMTCAVSEGSTDKLEWTTSSGTVAKVEQRDNGVCVITAMGQGTASIQVKPELQTSDDSIARSFTITVAKEPETFVNVTDAKGNSVLSEGVNLLTDVTLTAEIQPADSYDYVNWKVSDENAVALEIVNTNNKHTCKLKKLQAGKKVKLTVSTSNGLTKELMVNTGTSLTECTVDPIADHLYDGAMYKPVIVVKDTEGNALDPTTDYTVAYPVNSIAAGEKEVVVTGKGLFCDSITMKYLINPVPMGSVEIAAIANQTYTGKEILPAVIVKKDNKNLAKADYEVTYANNLNVGTATVTVTGKGNYSGTASATFAIDPKDIGKATAAFDQNVTIYEYTGSAITPEVIVKDGALELKAGTDYTLSYTNNKNIGTVAVKPTVTITGIGNYTGTKDVNFTIKAATLAEDMVTLSKTDYVYNGKNCKPKVTIKNSAGKKLSINKDYTILWPADLKSIGVKNITITGKGNYAGNVIVSYGVAEKVTVKKATIKSVKNSKAKKAAVTIKAVNGAEGYEISYSTSKKFTKDTTKVVTVSKTKATISKLKKGKTYYFKVRAYKTNSIGRKIYGKASAIKQVKIKK